MERTIVEGVHLTLDFYKGKLERKQHMMNDMNEHVWQVGLENIDPVQLREWGRLDAEVNLLRDVVRDLEIVLKGKE